MLMYVEVLTALSINKELIKKAALEEVVSRNIHITPGEMYSCLPPLVLHLVF